MKRCLILLALVTMLGTATADTTQTFNVTGTFADSATVSGTITVDETTGQVTAASLTLSNSPHGANGTYTYLAVGYGYSSPNPFYNLPVGLNGTNSLPQLNLLIAAPSETDPLLSPYNGGNICSQASPCNGEGSDYFPGGETSIALQSGTVSSASPPPPSAVPALSPWALGGLAILLAATAAGLLLRPKRV